MLGQGTPTCHVRCRERATGRRGVTEARHRGKIDGERPSGGLRSTASRHANTTHRHAEGGDGWTRGPRRFFRWNVASAERIFPPREECPIPRQRLSAARIRAGAAAVAISQTTLCPRRLTQREGHFHQHDFRLLRHSTHPLFPQTAKRFPQFHQIPLGGGQLVLRLLHQLCRSLGDVCLVT